LAIARRNGIFSADGEMTIGIMTQQLQKMTAYSLGAFTILGVFEHFGHFRAFFCNNM
jgi:hypothetical protein